MSALDLLTVLVAVLALAVAAAAAVVCARAARLAAELAAATEAFRARAEPALAELRGTVARAGAEVDRVEDLLDVASSIGGRVDAATDVTYRALTSPVIKGVALATGTRRAAGRLRGAPAGRER